MIGKKISHYKILNKLGEGGMGEVYLAEDTKLKREVALKFLSSKSISSEEEKSRFMREAQAAAALNHPNIATIFEIDEHQGDMFIAMEHVEGQNLKQLIESGPMKLRDVIRIATQIAEGLQAAHTKNIVHRDIKSANIMITGKGQVKIMDFGLAKLSGVSLLTREGTTVGTVSYMSPEQTHGEPVDQRTDIWSLGVIIYEMVSGQLPFKGQYDSAVIYSIMHEEPEPLTALRTGVPMELERIVFKALTKDKENRYQNVNEIPVDLKTIDIKSSSSTKLETSSYTYKATKKSNQWRQMIPWGITILAIVFSLWMWSAPTTPTRKEVMRFVIPIPTDLHLSNYGGNKVSISPDGSRLAYIGRSDNVDLLYFREMDKLAVTPIRGTEGARTAIFSPNGNWIAYYAYNRFKKVSISGGAPHIINEKAGGYWKHDNTINNMYDLKSHQGTVKDITDTLNRENRIWERLPDEYRNIQLLPGGKSLLLTLRHSTGNMEVGVFSISNGEYKRLIEKSANAQYIRTGHLVYTWVGEILAVPFDLKNLTLTGLPVTVVENFGGKSNVVVNFCISDNGTMVYARGREGVAEMSLEWVNQKGVAESYLTLPSNTTYDGGLRISPDGKWFTIGREQERWNIWMYDIDRGAGYRLTDDKGDEYWTVWTPDNKWVIFNSSQSGKSWDLYRMQTDGGEKIEKLATSIKIGQSPHSISPDGRFLAYTEYMGIQGQDIWILTLSGESTTRPFLTTEDSEFHPSFSPDGKWLAYTSNASGRNEVYVRPYPGPSGIFLISNNGGTEPVWHPGERRLFYRQEKKMMVVTYKTNPTFQAGIPEQLFESDHLVSPFSWGRMYDLYPDGKRFLMIKDKYIQTATREIHVVVNWFEELKEKMAAAE